MANHDWVYFKSMNVIKSKFKNNLQNCEVLYKQLKADKMLNSMPTNTVDNISSFALKCDNRRHLLRP